MSSNEFNSSILYEKICVIYFADGILLLRGNKNCIKQRAPQTIKEINLQPKLAAKL